MKAFRSWLWTININMRCIEIRLEIERMLNEGVININMRCIEIDMINMLDDGIRRLTLT